MAKVGIIGGSGLYEIEGIEIVDEVSLMTPFGEPSANFVCGKLNDCDVVFLPRHGKGHTLSPSEVNYRANIFGMRKLGVKAIVSISACGSLKEHMKPLDFVVPDQFVDRTNQRENSFCGDGIVGHVAMAEPYSEELRIILINCAKDLGLRVHDKGTYLTIEGPQFPTKAESHLYRQWGMDIIGMTNATEAKLAREAEISYATLAAVTDFDCWHESEESVTIEMVIANLRRNSDNAKDILKLAIPQIAGIEKFSAEGALRNAIATAPDLIPENKLKELGLK